MAKYRLSYLSYGGYKAIDLEKLECLKGKKVTDIQVIDEFTTSFKNMDTLLDFLKRNKVISEDINKLVITVDKKQDGEIINKKIYRGENLLFKSDKNFLNTAFIYKWVISNNDDFNTLINICDNYIEKYKNAYNRITGSSYILSVFNSLRALALNKKENNGFITPNELKEFNETIEDFINLEFYKIDKDILNNTGKIERKLDNGTHKKSYRNIHDFVILLKSLDIDLNKSMVSKPMIETIKVRDNNFVEEQEEFEEFLTSEDINRVNVSILKDYKYEKYEGYQDGIDYHAPITEEELTSALYESGMKLVKKGFTK